LDHRNYLNSLLGAVSMDSVVLAIKFLFHRKNFLISKKNFPITHNCVSLQQLLRCRSSFEMKSCSQQLTSLSSISPKLKVFFYDTRHIPRGNFHFPSHEFLFADQISPVFFSNDFNSCWCPCCSRLTGPWPIVYRRQLIETLDGSVNKFLLYF
jgi:hypothetical protein